MVSGTGPMVVVTQVLMELSSVHGRGHALQVIKNCVKFVVALVSMIQ